MKIYLIWHECSDEVDDLLGIGSTKEGAVRAAIEHVVKHYSPAHREDTSEEAVKRELAEMYGVEMEVRVLDGEVFETESREKLTF